MHAENALSDCGDDRVRSLYGMLLGCPAHHADSVLRRKIFRPRLGSVPGTVSGGHRNRQRYELYRWSGRLASSVTIMVATFFSVVAIGTNAGIAPITCAVVGALLGFLLFNVYPASVFMGDTGHWRSADLWSRQPI